MAMMVAVVVTRCSPCSLRSIASLIKGFWSLGLPERRAGRAMESRRTQVRRLHKPKVVGSG